MKMTMTERVEKVNCYLRDYDNMKKIVLKIAKVISFIIILLLVIVKIDYEGGAKNYLCYPEKDYCRLEQEAKNCIIPNESITMDNLSDDIWYKKSYSEGMDKQGIYTITITDEDNKNIYTPIVTATIDQNLDMNTLSIEREKIKFVHYLCLIVLLMVIFIGGSWLFGHVISIAFYCIFCAFYVIFKLIRRINLKN